MATSVFATIAYLTSHSYVSNTFTVGKVNITLTESKVNTDGTLYDEGATQVSENVYHLVPNKSYVKDPKITVLPGSEESYLFIVVNNGIAPIECTNIEHKNPKENHNGTIAEQLNENGWEYYTTTSKGDIYIYTGMVESTDGVATAVGAGEYKLFKSFTVTSDSSASISSYVDASIVINAMAIQAATLETSEAFAILADTYSYIVGNVN